MSPDRQPAPAEDSKQQQPTDEKNNNVGLCSCPQKCGQRVDQKVRAGLLERFQGLGEHSSQNAYLQSYIEMRSVNKRLWCQEERVKGRLQRRVSCKYKLPLRVPTSPLIPHTQDTQPPVLTTNSKGKATFVVGTKPGVETVEVCQKAFMNVYGITEKRIRLQREKLIARLRNNALESTPEDPPLDAAANMHDIAILDRFFSNQLWKPEYIEGAAPYHQAVGK